MNRNPFPAIDFMPDSGAAKTLEMFDICVTMLIPYIVSQATSLNSWMLKILSRGKWTAVSMAIKTSDMISDIE